MKPTSTLGQSPRRVVASLRRRHEDQERQQQQQFEYEEDFEEFDATTSAEKKRNTMTLPSVRNVIHNNPRQTRLENNLPAKKKHVLMTPTPDMTQFEHENKIQMSKVFVGLCITTLCSLANAATMNVTFENQNITLRDINTKGSQTRTTERWGHVEIIGAGKVRASSILSLSLLFLIFEIKHKQNKNIYRNTNSSKHFLVEIYDVMP